MAPIVGTAGWSIPASQVDCFRRDGSVLERYATRFDGVEVNSSFYRPHRPSTWARWAASVPPDFRFSVKVPKVVTHERKLVGCGDALAAFCDQVAALGDKLAVLLVQLPPKLSFDRSLVTDFFGLLSSLTDVQAVCEPRHLSWFDDDADRLLRDMRVARVAADPALTPSAALPGGWPGIAYWRLHGSPVRYRSEYGADRLEDYAQSVRRARDAGSAIWCIFDNTASGAATEDALRFSSLVG
ncbi:DUF72 domain-containing protein [Sphingomonas sp. MMS24-J13]|uniref:DUF72 domain-containing protein n=1 Tax=Sphingomonas sp. MMS24-J13 TaxID=3238686 RepID=UPI00384F5E1C